MTTSMGPEAYAARALAGAVLYADAGELAIALRWAERRRLLDVDVIADTRDADLAHLGLAGAARVPLGQLLLALRHYVAGSGHPLRALPDG